MGMVSRRTNYRVIVEPDRSYLKLLKPHERDAEDKNNCKHIMSAIKRHVDDIGHIDIYSDLEETCEFCGAAWTETTTHNGGCCIKDAELQDQIERDSQCSKSTKI